MPRFPGATALDAPQHRLQLRRFDLSSAMGPLAQPKRTREHLRPAAGPPLGIRAPGSKQKEPTMVLLSRNQIVVGLHRWRAQRAGLPSGASVPAESGGVRQPSLLCLGADPTVRRAAGPLVGLLGWAVGDCLGYSRHQAERRRARLCLLVRRHPAAASVFRGGGTAQGHRQQRVDESAGLGLRPGVNGVWGLGTELFLQLGRGRVW